MTSLTVKATDPEDPMIDEPSKRAFSRSGLELTTRDDGMTTLLPRLDPESIAAHLDRWRYAGCGRRPVDHVGRDLLFGSLARDYRAWPYHIYREDFPEWAQPALEQSRTVAEFKHRKTLIKHLVLRLVHELWLARLVEDRDGRMTQTQHDAINALYACRPVGLALAWHAHDGRPHDFKCWMNRLCPWCHCRKVVRLYKRLIAGPCEPTRAVNKVLVMAKIRVEDDDDEILTADRVGQVLGRWKPQLLHYGRRLGMVGGLVGHQVGPWLANGMNSRRGFRHDISLLAEVPCEVGGGWSQAGFEQLKRLAGFGERPEQSPVLTTGSADDGVAVEVTAMPMKSAMALRWLLAGSAGHPMWGDASQITIERNQAAMTHQGNPATRKRIGVDGALALQPSFLYSFDQGFSSLAATAGRHLVALFGTWKGVRLEDDDIVRRQAGRPGRGEALERLNDQRQKAATAEVQALLPSARRVFDELTMATGRHPGRLQLQRRLAESGVTVSVRQAVALIKELRSHPGSNGPSRTETRQKTI